MITGLHTHVRAGKEGEMKLAVNFWLLNLGDEYVKKHFTTLSFLCIYLKHTMTKYLKELLKGKTHYGNLIVSVYLYGLS